MQFASTDEYPAQPQQPHMPQGHHNEPLTLQSDPASSYPSTADSDVFKKIPTNTRRRGIFWVRLLFIYLFFSVVKYTVYIFLKI